MKWPCAARTRACVRGSCCSATLAAEARLEAVFPQMINGSDHFSDSRIDQFGPNMKTQFHLSRGNKPAQTSPLII